MRFARPSDTDDEGTEQRICRGPTIQDVGIIPRKLAAGNEGSF